jgi:hypothetical protein
MTQQPEALRLADKIAGYRSPDCGEAAAELRRLHEENEMFRVMHQSHADKLKAVGAINAQLLELMREIGNANAAQVAPVYSELARAAIAAAKGEA